VKTAKERGLPIPTAPHGKKWWDKDKDEEREREREMNRDRNREREVAHTLSKAKSFLSGGQQTVTTVTATATQGGSRPTVVTVAPPNHAVPEVTDRASNSSAHLLKLIRQMVTQIPEGGTA
jgi:hypothetical protein